MAYYAISYQLNKEKDYQKLWDELKRLNAHKAMNSFWFLDLTTDETSVVRDHFKGFKDDDDAICVVKIESSPKHHMAFKGTNDWISKRF
ncbi:hypothetical protein GCM10009069_08150 [Algimonas arctica]|uniref:CRISPR-associated protein Cas2 n=1 Tax=Algimonas arctica TaxID=1479486 RepID=A0A8J3CN43_9PROT|nr:CRISPR-associated protein Cas2 [Algimonas arctica]GHA87215.1 hypothetical protein GCM10009069_08150 [Algimonas arctica]